MDTQHIDSHAKFATLLTSISKDPASWQGWSSLLITLQDIDPALQQECLFWAKSVVSASLSDFEGRVYFYENMAIHIVCKNVPWDVLSQTGQHVCSLIYDEGDVRTDCLIYDLASEGEDYMHAALAKSSIFSMPMAVPIKKSPEKSFQREENVQCSEKLILNHDDYTKVLLIEDDPVTRWMVRNALKHECQFATSPTANKAFSMYSTFLPDVVFLDINLPDKSGYEVLEWIIRNDPGACVVMFSSEDNLDNISNALESGAKGFIAKPFLRESLLQYIHGSLGVN